MAYADNTAPSQGQDGVQFQDQNEQPQKKKAGRKPKIGDESFDGSVKSNSPEDEFIGMEFDPNKKYVFQLVNENMERKHPVYNYTENRPEPHKRFKPYQNIVYTSQIIWEGKRRMIRYYDGCTSIFVDEQPKDKETIDQLINQTRRDRHFADGKLVVSGDEYMLLLYLYACSWNIDSPFRTQAATSIFRPQDSGKILKAEIRRVDMMEEALQLSRDVPTSKMLAHAAYLHIPMIDYDSGNKLEVDEIKVAYRKAALENPEKFIQSYNDKGIEIRYMINKALEDGSVTNKFNVNKASWSSGTHICDISGVRSMEGISDKLVEFSMLPDGEEFVMRLKNLYK